MTAATATLDGHLWHIVLAASWLPIFGFALLWQKLAERRRRRAVLAPVVAPVSAPVSAPVLTDNGRSTWIQAAAVSAFCAALVHLAVMPDHFRESPLYGTFFLTAAAGQMGFAVWILVRPTRTVARAGIAGSVLMVAMWLVSRTIGVPIGPDHGATETFGVLDALATAAEAVMAVACAMALRRWSNAAQWRWSQWTMQIRVAAPMCVIATIIASGLAPRS